MLILSAGELQIRQNGEKGVPLLGRNLANLSKSCKSVLPLKGRKRCWLISNPKKRIENAYTQDGRITNSPERVCPNGFARAGLPERLLEGDGKNPVSTVWMGSKFARTSGGWLFFNLNKRIENAYTQCGRIANSPERGFLVAYGEKSSKSMQIIQIFFLFLYLCCDMRTMTV